MVGPLALLSHWVEEAGGSDKRQVAQVITIRGTAEDQGTGGGGTAEQGLSHYTLPPLMGSWILVGLEVTFQLLGWCP